MKKAILNLTVLVLLMGPVGARAIMFTVEGGQLVSAWDVIVNGTSLDVVFQEGSCVDLFDGCDAAEDFFFTSPAAAHSASEALLDQVLLDGVDGDFDTEPELTFGCVADGTCFVYTPHGVESNVGVIDLSVTVNQRDGLLDLETGTGISVDVSTSEDDGPCKLFCVTARVKYNRSGDPQTQS